MDRIIIALGTVLVLATPAFADDASLANLRSCLASGACSGYSQDATSGYGPDVQTPTGSASREVGLVSAGGMCNTTYKDPYTTCDAQYKYVMNTYCTDAYGTTTTYSGNVPCP